MAILPPLQLYNLVMGVLAAAGLGYLLYAYRFVFGYRRFLDLVVIGLFLFAVGGPLVDLIAPEWAHVVHGIAALFVIFGLYNPVHNDLRREEWAELFLEEPGRMRKPGEWMTPMDDQILELFHSADLVLTPAVIALNIGRSREEVNRRLGELLEHGLVAKPDRGKYHITELGERYLHGEIHVALLELSEQSDNTTPDGSPLP